VEEHDRRHRDATQAVEAYRPGVGRRGHGRRCLLVLAVVLLLPLASCGDDGDDGTSVGRDGAGDLSSDVRTVPDPLPEGEPGDLIAVAPHDSTDVPDGATAWDVLYLSTGVDGEPVAVSGIVYAPEGEPPEGGRPIISWAHGATGVADKCAPSRGEYTRAGYSIIDLGVYLSAGYVVAATDFEGLGTPGPHRLLVGSSEAFGVLDIARAAAQVPEGGAGTSVVVIGPSQGGHAALFAAEEAERYAPDLDVVGSVAAAPVGEMSTLVTGAGAIPEFFGFLVAVGFAWADTYDLDLTTVLTPAALDRIDVVEQECIYEVNDAYADRDPSAWKAAEPMDVPQWAERIQENQPGQVASDVPLLVLQGDVDDVIPPATTDALVDRLCGVGTGVEYLEYPGVDHFTLLQTAASDLHRWVNARFDGGDFTPTC
jgi:pimeloyl-ACP methyl ester carboxylesterase